jgi:flagellar FliL protein
MTDDSAKPPQPPTPPKPRGRKKRLLLFLILGLVVVLGGGGGAWWFLAGRPAAAPAEGDASVEPAPDVQGGGVVALDPFLVNLADPAAARYLRVTLRLVVPEAKEAEEIAKNEVVRTRLRAAILDLLATQTAGPLLTPEGKAALRVEITKHCTRILEPVHVIDVLFTDFVVQL